MLNEVLPPPTSTEVVDFDLENQRMATAALSLLTNKNVRKSRLAEILHQKNLTVSDENVLRGTSQRPACRFEAVVVNDTQCILDVAHNPPGLKELFKKFNQEYSEHGKNKKIRIVIGMSSDKDLNLVSKILLNNVDANKVHLVEAAHPRAATLPEILAATNPTMTDCVYDLTDPSITVQVLKALQLAKENGEILIICGSVFLMAEAREALGFDEPRDSAYVAEVAGCNLRHGQENFGNNINNYRSEDEEEDEEEEEEEEEEEADPKISKF